jgi:esterase
VRLHVEASGPDDGTPVVFLHGVSGSLRTYEWLPEQITDGRRIVRADLRGHGRSEHDPGHYAIDDYGEDVAVMLREEVGRPAVLVGHSLGGVVAWWVAQRHPELAIAAFLEDPPLYMGEPDEHLHNSAIPIFATLLDLVAEWKEEGVTVDAAAAQLDAAPAGPDFARTTADVLCDGVAATRAEAMLQMDTGVLEGAADRSTLAPTDTTSPVGAPVFVLAADDARGAAFPTRHAERLAISHPEVRVVRVAGAGHGIHDEREHRGDYVEALAAFLATHG